MSSFIILFHKSLLSCYANFFTVDTAKPGADAIIILSGGSYNRIVHALDLFSKNYAPILLLTDEKKMSPRFSNLLLTNEEIALRIMKELKMEAPITKVPSIKGGATSTFDEAYDLKKFIQKKGFKRFIIVTDSFHTRRAIHAFEKIFLRTKIKIEISPAKNKIYNESNWWKSDQGISAYILESIKYPVYYFSTRNSSLIENN